MPVNLAAILTSMPVLALIGYAALVVVLALILQPMRLRMIDTAEEMLAERHWNKDQRENINDLLDSCASIGASIALPVALVISIFAETLRLEPEQPIWLKRLGEDERFHALLNRYFVSLLGANPLIAMVTVPLMVLNVVVAAVVRSSTLRSAIEEPILKSATASANWRTTQPV